MAEDELASIFSSKFNVTKDKNTTDAQHPRLSEFKEKPSSAGDQARRRKDHLIRQKQKRFDAQNYARKLAEGDLDEDDFKDIQMEIADEKAEQTKNVQKRYQYRDQLMLSEWIVDPPTDLHSHWTMVVCPAGKRVLVVAHKGKTMMFAKNGYLHRKFPSFLPGGNRFKQIPGFHSTILDGIFDEANNTLFILDMMCYKGYPLYDCETSFRLFWINTKLFEESEHNLKEISKYNKFRLIPCPSVTCKEDQIVEMVTSMHDFQVDGLLFYHNESHYIPGRTPLVGWLKPFMLPKILGIQLPESFLNEPSSSTGINYNREILQEANKDLQNTNSDKSIYNIKDSKKKASNSKESMDQGSGSVRNQNMATSAQSPEAVMES